jgi:hypothetical protein
MAVSEYKVVHHDGCRVLVHYDRHTLRFYAAAPGVRCAAMTETMAVGDAVTAWRRAGCPESSFEDIPPGWKQVEQLTVP